MRLLLDTHLAVWWLIRGQRVPPEARELVENATDPVAISRALACRGSLDSSPPAPHPSKTV